MLLDEPSTWCISARRISNIKEMILAALAAGKHVFCEKPVAMNSSEIGDIVQAVDHAPGLLGVCYQNRLNPTSQRI
jgi:predicted dehydrogenase